MDKDAPLRLSVIGVSIDNKVFDAVSDFGFGVGVELDPLAQERIVVAGEGQAKGMRVLELFEVVGESGGGIEGLTGETDLSLLSSEGRSDQNGSSSPSRKPGVRDGTLSASFGGVS